MDVLGKKTPGQREDEEAERLVRPLPKKKPPRHDRRRERMVVDQDPDTDGDPDLKGDPDLSMNYKTIGGSVDLLRVIKLAKSRDKVKVYRKDGQRVVEVSKETLKERGGEYEEYEPQEKDKWEEEALDLARRMKEDLALESRLKSLLNPKSDLGGLAKGNPSFPVEPFEKGLSPSIKTLGDLLEVAEKAFAPKAKNPSGKPTSKSSPVVDKPVPEGKPEKTPRSVKKPQEKAPEEKPSKTEAPEESPEAEGKPEVKRRTPTASEVEEARSLIVRTFPPRLAGRFMDLHPDDVRSLVSNFNEFKSLGPIRPGNIESELAKAGRVTLNPDKIEPPKTVTKNGKEVELSTLTPEERVEAVQQHRMAVLGAQLALRSRAIQSMKKAGTPPHMARRLTDFLLGTNGMTPEERMKKALEKSRDLFVEASADESLTATDERFGVPKMRAPENKDTLGFARRRALFSVKDPAARVLLVAAFQGEDYRKVVAEYFGPGAREPISSKDSARSILDKVRKAEAYFKERSKIYPEEILSAIDDPASLFRVRVRKAVSDMDPTKARKLAKYLAESEADAYDRAHQAYLRALREYQEKLRKWKSSGGKGPVPMEPKPPVKPAEYGLVRTPENPSEVQSRMEKILGVLKKGSFSSYSMGCWQMLLARLGGGQQDQIGSRGFAAASQAGVSMTIKFAKEDADRILSRLDKLANDIQTNHKRWGMDFSTAKALVNELDRTADEVEKAAYGEESLLARQVEVLKQAKVIQQDSDEGYMATFNAPMAPRQTDPDEGYMSQFADDQSEAVATGKSTTGRPLAP